jgi:hypothetical protein
LYGIAIVNDTLAYAAGAVYLIDSTGQLNTNAYSFMKWNGDGWGSMRIEFMTFCGQPYTGSYPTSAMCVFSPQNIWIASASQIAYWNGVSQTSAACIPVSVNRLWGISSNSLYAVGYGGEIAHYDGDT